MKTNSNNTEKATGTHRLPHGFDIGVSKDVLRPFYETNLALSVGWAVVYHLTIFILAVSTVMIYVAGSAVAGIMGGIIAAGAMYLPMLVMIARAQRGIELMVHDASHRAWSRSSPRMNDLLANALVGYPTFMTMKSYRSSHWIHHSGFGGANDPCKRRFKEIQGFFENKRYLAGFVKYIAGYYAEVAGKPAAVLRMLGWHTVVYIIPLSVTVGVPMALLFWGLFWLVPQFVSLPVLRLIAEFEEHDYDMGKTEEGCTFTNRAILHTFLIHPFGDEYHWIHHALPAVPQHRHAALHELLMAQSQQYRSSAFRDTVLGPAKKPVA